MAISKPEPMEQATVGPTESEARTITIDVDGRLIVRAEGSLVISGAITHQFTDPDGGVESFSVKKGDRVTFRALTKKIGGTSVAWKAVPLEATP